MTSTQIDRRRRWLSIATATAVTSTCTWAGSPTEECGTFDPPRHFEFGHSLSSPLADDFDGDGDIDLVVTNEDPDFIPQLLVLLNEGDGTLLLQDVYETQGWAWKTLSVDIDGDTDADLILPTKQYVSVMLNLGNGRFGPETFYDELSGVAGSPVTSDVDRDGDPDLIASHWSTPPEPVTVAWLNDGSGVFSKSVGIPAPYRPLGMAAGDLDGDGDEDLATVYTPSKFLTVLLNDGDGNFQIDGMYPINVASSSVVFADFDDDGDLDMAANESLNYGIALFYNNGDATFPPRVYYPTGARPFSLVTGDLNADGAVDIAASTIFDPGVVVLLNQDGSFPSYDSFPGESYALIADFDGDGYPDLLSRSHESGNILKLRMNRCCFADIDGSGSVGLADLLLVLDAWGACAECGEDLDGDGSVGFTDILELLSNWGPCP